MLLSDTVEKKFTEVFDASEWMIETDTGWEDVQDVKQTIEYDVWQLTLENNYEIMCADDHIVFDDNMNERFVQDLSVGDLVMTETGPQKVIAVKNLGYQENMYDVGVNSENHRYYSNGILSHNTTCAAIYLTWYAMFNPDKTILIAAHKFSGSQEIMQRIRYVYEECPDFIRAGVTGYNKGSIEFENKSRIVSTTTTETTGRGMSISLLYLDEFDYVSPTIAFGMWASISPTLATGGSAIITSTPSNDEGQFAQIWKEANDKFDANGNEQTLGRNGFFPFFATWRDHPDRDEKWAEEELSRIGKTRFLIEHECQFITHEETLISSLKLAEMEGDEPLVNMGQTRWYKKPTPEYMYAVALDPSMGTGGDYAAIQVVELPSYEQVAEWRHNTTPIPTQIRILRDICTYLSEETRSQHSIFWSVENNSIGEAALIVIDDFGEENIPGMFISEPVRKGHVKKFRKGFNTTHSSKVSTCSRLKTMIENNQLKIHSKPFVSELKSFISSGASYKAKQGATDDLISAMMLAIRMMTVLKDWDPRIYESFSQAAFEEEYIPPMPIFISTGGR